MLRLFVPRHDLVNESVFQLEFGSPEAVGQCLARHLLHHAPPGKADACARLGGR